MSHLLNSVPTEGPGHVFTPEEILSYRYKMDPVLNTSQVDPDRGAPGLEGVRERWQANRG